MQTFMQYVLIDLLAVMFLYFAARVKGIAANLCVFLSAAPLLIQMVFRDYSVGTDYQRYINLYLNLLFHSSDAVRADAAAWVGEGWVRLCEIFGAVFSEKHIFFFAFIAVLTIVFFYKAILFENPKSYVGLAVYLGFCLYYNSFNQFRQMLAAAIVLYAWKYMKKRQMWTCFIWIGIAALFHHTALIMIPAYFAANRKISGRNLVVYCLGALLFVFSFDAIFSLLAELGLNYGRYLNGRYDIGFRMSTVLNTAVRSVMLIGCLAVRKEVLAKDEGARVLYNMVIICSVFQFAAMISFIWARVTTYFFVFYIPLLPRVLEAVSDKFRQKKLIPMLFTLALFMYHTVYYFYSIIDGGYGVYSFLSI